MNNSRIIERINFTIEKGTEIYKNLSKSNISDAVRFGLYSQFSSLTYSTLISVVGKEHIYYKEFSKHESHSQFLHIKAGIAILENLKYELVNGWLETYKQLISAEIFSDFLEMSEYFLSENYKDAAAVMIGAVLEEHMRQLCNKNSILYEVNKQGKIESKKANLLNDELAKASVYSTIDKKNITGWLGLRNSAAHGKYDEYSKGQVEVMYSGVSEFIARIN
ncbi:hypothetical protein GS399_15890 [Pedobacter sp. HMF7647]|uniref:DUF4145 domain-containing protein n=1 Tax=Hufsiella arboris TaxID=2695275 RepID=A0A7K1YCZ0_9SPHI|nr:hypothetical protein [Hufsiella arboris]MXV52457.1 hypothetical protein [Hufsiella arboris]